MRSALDRRPSSPAPPLVTRAAVGVRARRRRRRWPPPSRRSWAVPPIREGRVKLDLPPLVENGNAVPLTVSVESPMTRGRPHQGDPRLQREEPAAARLRRPPRPAQRPAVVATRIKLGDSQKIVAIAETSNGQFWSASADVIVTLAACIEDIMMANVLINAPKTAKPGELVEIKALILHPMETGFRPGTNGRIIPRNIIERFTATWNGAEIFRMELSPAIAANPFVSFFAVATRERHHRLPLDRRRRLRRRGAGRHRRGMKHARDRRSAWRRSSSPPSRWRRARPTSGARATRTWARRCRRCRTTTRPIPACCSCSSAGSSGRSRPAPPTSPAPTATARRRSMKGVAARYPAIPQGADRPVDLEGRINLCRTDQPAGRAACRRKAASCWRSRPMSRYQSRGQPIAPPDRSAARRRSASRAPRSTGAARASSTSPAPSATTTMPARSSPASTIPRGASDRLSDLSPGMAGAGLAEAPAAQLPGRHSRRGLCLRRSRIRGARDLSDGPRQGHGARRARRAALNEEKYSPAPARRQTDLLRRCAIFGCPFHCRCDPPAPRVSAC